MMWDAVVAGAGPAGVAAAATLRRRGLKVAVCDRVSTSEHKIGEALPGVALAVLASMGLPVPTRRGRHRPFGGNLSAWGGEDLLATDFIRDPAGNGWRLDRKQFDAELLAASIAQGVTHIEARVHSAARSDGKWRLHFDDGSSRATAWLVDATGRSAKLARRAGAARLQASRNVAQYAICEFGSEFPTDRTVVEAVPCGWWYGARLPSGRTLVGLHTYPAEARTIRRDPAALSQRLSSTRHLGGMAGRRTFTSLLPPVAAGGSRLDRFSGEGWIACGDAALSFDPISGHGILFALRSGRDAGSAVASAISEDESASLEQYSGGVERIWSRYRAGCRAVYASERRWLDMPFWSRLNMDEAEVKNIS